MALSKERWDEIKEFAQELCELTEDDIDTWVTHLLAKALCSCSSCQRHSVYTNIVEALEKWELRAPAKEVSNDGR